MVVDFFLDGNLFKKGVRIPLEFYRDAPQIPDYYVLDTNFIKTVLGVYKPNPIGPNTFYDIRWYVASSKPWTRINWEGLPYTDPFKSRRWDLSFDLKQYRTYIKDKYIAFNVTLEKRVGLSCAMCEKGASFVHMAHDIESDLRTPIDAYCSHACFEMSDK